MAERRWTPLVLVGVAAAGLAVAAVVYFTSGDEEDQSSVAAAQATAPVSATTTSAATTARTTTTSPTPTTPALVGPAAVVHDYFSAINRRDYLAAWHLGARNLHPDLDSFIAGLATTAHDHVRIESTTGNRVDIVLDARQTDGTHRYFAGYFVVEGGEIVSARISVR